EVDDVALDLPGGGAAVRADRVGITLKMLPLLSGEFQIRRVDIDGGYIDAALLQTALVNENEPSRFGPFEIAKIDELTEQTLHFLETVSHALDDRGINGMRLRNTSITGLMGGNEVDSPASPLKINTLRLSDRRGTDLRLEADVSYADQSIVLSGRAYNDPATDNRLKLTADVTGLHSGKLIKELSQNPRRKFRMESGVDLKLTAIEGLEDEAPELSAVLQLSAGELFMDGVAAQIKPSTINLDFDSQKQSLEILQSTLTFGDSNYEFHGGVIDLKNLPEDKNPDAEGKRGFAFDLIVDEAIVAPTDSSEPPIKVAMKAFARLVSDERRLYIDDFVISGVTGSVFSSARVSFSDTSPEVSFVANIDKMDTGTVKQLWPYWIAKMPRRWVHQNLFGGVVTEGKISIFVPEGRMAQALPNRLDLDAQQLQIDFNITDARFDVAGDIPAVRNADGLFSLRGKHLELKIEKGASYFPSGRSVVVSDGLFVIDRTDVKPLMAQVDIDVSGDASAVAELVSFRPIDALKHTPWQADDFDGPVTSRVNITFGLVQQQNPPSPNWDVAVNLDGVSMGPKVEGMTVADAKGTMHIDTKTIKIDSTALLNGMQATVDFTEPLDRAGEADPIRMVKLGLTEADRDQFAPALNEYIKGTVYLTAKLRSDGSQEIDADLTEAQLILPWIGWSKGKGIRSNATFEMVPSNAGNQVASVQTDTATDASEDDFGLPSAFEIRNFDIKGEGFSAKGNLHFDNGEVVKADLGQVSLTRKDSFAVNLEKKSGTYIVNIAGKAVDLRSSIKHLMSEAEVAEIGEDVSEIDLKVRANEAHGFNDQVVKEFNFDYRGQGDTILALDLSAVTARGDTLNAVGKHNGSQLAVNLRSNDAGNLARFTDIYPKLQGGTLDVNLIKPDGGAYVGTVDLNDFSVIDDENLKILASSSPNGGESLSQAARQKINVSRAQFQHASARVDKGQGYLRVSDGIARGLEVGLAFQGTVFDDNDGMNITGTFMPAYGLNRIFGEIPVLGAILGNGRDRGLIGITFRLYGDVDDPKLQVNPISLIAPGIFRSIFQFRNDAPFPTQRPRENERESSGR
ncbi:MAG: DUF3971 domain-containing protein, partial [Pseudomonadota bacterium]